MTPRQRFITQALVALVIVAALSIAGNAQAAGYMGNVFCSPTFGARVGLFMITIIVCFL